MPFALKLLLTPTLIGLVSLAGRRWGPAVSGWLVGLPLTSGPVAIFLALDQGTLFASRAAEGSLLGLISVECFCLAYRLDLRFNWPVSMLVSWTVFFAITFVLEYLLPPSPPLVLAFVSVIAVIAITLKLLPDTSNVVITAKPPRWETPLRMLVATVFVLLLTGAASFLGPTLSGLLTPFPTFATILGVFTHRFQGAAAANRLMRGVVTGTFTFAIFFLVVAGLIAKRGIAASFGLAVIAALLLHGGTLLFLRKRNIESFLD